MAPMNRWRPRSQTIRLILGVKPMAWTRRLGLIPCIGGYIITILMDEAGENVEQMSQQFIRFPELEKDWAP